jgi:NAD(P)-dependent dehydrogenase (short-subunit alcohol dehydrogenase family)
LKLDVTSKSDIQNAFSAAIEHFGRIDVVYSNSGYGVLGELESVDEDAARRMFEVNLWGAANVALEAVRVFRDVNKPAGGRLLLASSYAGVSAITGLGHYSSSYVL